MKLWIKFALSFVVGAGGATIAKPDREALELDASPVDCEGCEPSSGIRVYTWQIPVAA